MSKHRKKFFVLRSPSVGNYETDLVVSAAHEAKKATVVKSLSELDSVWQEFSDEWQTYETSVTPTVAGSLDAVPFKD